MFSTKKSLERILQIYKKEISRQISKTTSVTNSDAMAPRLDLTVSKPQPHEDIGIPKKLLKLQKYHRFLSTLTSQEMPMATRGLAVTKDQSREFMACFPDIIRDLTEAGKHNDVPEAGKWLAKLLQYNVPNGKKNRGLATVLAYKMLERDENLTPENVHLANIMGWCTEMFHTHQLLQNDIIEGTQMRRGAPCWYRRADVGLGGINDASLVQSAMYSTLKRHFGNKPYYKNVLETFNEMLLKCSVGQYLDKSLMKTDKPDITQFTMDKYEAISKYKTAYYTFQMPVTLALLMSGVDDPETHRQAKNILLAMGEFFQIQDDFLDCFGDPSVMGKTGTDIQDGKCTWLAVVALQRASPAQKQIMEDHYGSSKPEDVAIIKDLYEELQLPHTYSVYEEATYDLLRTQIQQVTRGLPHDFISDRHIQMAANLSIYQSKKEREIFQDVLPCIVDSLLTSPHFAEVPDAANWLRRVIDYNLAGGKKTRGLTTVLAYEMLEDPEKITEDSLRDARVMGWCVELLQAYLLVNDDIIDGSSTRRGVPCWYRIPEVGMGAINDAILIYVSIMNTLKTFFCDKPNYSQIMELFNEILLYTSIGQHLDYTMAHRNKNDYSLFTIDRYYAIVKYKTAYYTYKLPCFLALYMANKTDKKAQQAAERILLEMGKLFQVQDDFIDCFSDESISGKAGTDIQEGKCSWLAVTALQHCNPDQRALFEEFYGSKDPQHVHRIKQLYEELQLPQLYKEFEQSTYERIVHEAELLPEAFGANFPNLISKLLDMIYKRKQ
ncbi:uncharacterized protein LOC128677488 [Plodia interpunctella]|uniref:uncharacterized protein LOC128677488 n=1 Tax=Plodia interpunctella TaxID=58824 RepID=UPI002367606A|nr:uncharacterized protein LOC128677488 [Plodia interpunctella]